MRRMLYYEEDNRFEDCDGHIIFDIFSYITPNDLMIFRKNRKSDVINDIEIIYNYDYITQACYMYRFWGGRGYTWVCVYIMSLMREL